MQIKFAKKFKKQYEKAGSKIQSAFGKRLVLFQQNPHYPLLNNHALIGEYSEFRSIDITGDWRAIFSEELDDNDNKIIIFELLGTHSQLYG